MTYKIDNILQLAQISNNVSEDEITSKLLPILFDKLIDLSGPRYDLYTHRMITTAILLAMEYEWEDVYQIIESDSKLKNVYSYLCDIDEISNNFEYGTDEYNQCTFYNEWHDTSRHVTDHLSEDDQPGTILKRVIKLYNYNKKTDYSGFKHNLFSFDSTVYLEDYV